MWGVILMVSGMVCVVLQEGEVSEGGRRITYVVLLRLLVDEKPDDQEVENHQIRNHLKMMDQFVVILDHQKDQNLEKNCLELKKVD
jgi:hypothetical protein